jgi:hypothetical protein
MWQPEWWSLSASSGFAVDNAARLTLIEERRRTTDCTSMKMLRYEVGLVWRTAKSAYLGLALFMQSLMNDLRSLPVRFFLSARFLQTFILSF